LATVLLLQISDLHLGARFGWLPRDRSAIRRREQITALRKAIEHAITRGVHAILIPGDLFDRAEPDAETMTSALDAFRIAGCPPVFIAPGNHDPWSESSPAWSAGLLKARGWSWPEHVRVFTEPHWRSQSISGLPVRIWGRCFTPGMASTARPLDAEARGAIGALLPTELHVGLFHGSLESNCPPGQKIVGPFSLDEIRLAPFAYLAVGHYHRAFANEHYAYAGSVVALDIGETGGHGALEVHLEFGAGPARAQVTPVVLDPRRTHHVDVDVAQAPSAEEVDRRILSALDAAGVTAADLVRVALHGRLGPGVRYTGFGPPLAERAWHMRLDLGALRPDYDFEALRQASDETTEGRFARVLLERIEQETDPDRRAAIERALYYGLDAFRLKDVAPVYEELRP
jgi:DNA repair exonuclease SbcCD nuclease subunit